MRWAQLQRYLGSNIIYAISIYMSYGMALLLPKNVKYFELFIQSRIPGNIVWDNLFEYTPKRTGTWDIEVQIR
jgi:hypothetical protein